MQNVTELFFMQREPTSLDRLEYESNRQLPTAKSPPMMKWLLLLLLTTRKPADATTAAPTYATVAPTYVTPAPSAATGAATTSPTTTPECTEVPDDVRFLGLASAVATRPTEVDVAWQAATSDVGSEYARYHVFAAESPFDYESNDLASLVRLFATWADGFYAETSELSLVIDGLAARAWRRTPPTPSSSSQTSADGTRRFERRRTIGRPSSTRSPRQAPRP